MPALRPHRALRTPRLTHTTPHPILCAQEFTIMGFARSKMTLQEFRDMISLTLTCRIDQR
jgi:hypothetical protein